METKIYNKEGEKEDITFEGDIAHGSRIINLYKDGEFVGSMALWVNLFNKTLHIYFPSLIARLTQEFMQDE